MSNIVVIGTDPNNLGAELKDRGASVRYAAGTANKEELEAVEVENASILIVTDVGLATSIPVAKELNPSLRILVYARDSLPEFAKPQVDHIIDPELVPQSMVAEELLEQ